MERWLDRQDDAVRTESRERSTCLFRLEIVFELPWRKGLFALSLGTLAIYAPRGTIHHNPPFESALR
jgi:hypothetical protein